MLDGFIVGTAMPTIVSDLGGASLPSWVMTAHARTTAISTPIRAKFGDLFGRKRMFQVSVVVFLVAGVLIAAAPSMGLLIAPRGRATAPARSPHHPDGYRPCAGDRRPPGPGQRRSAPFPHNER